MTKTIMGLPERFWAKTRIEDAGYGTPCLTWTACTSTRGYGKYGDNGQSLYAHRVAYEARYGQIPKSGRKRLVIDHLCKNRACVNADHLEVVTDLENLERGHVFDVVAAQRRAQTHCRNGHPYTPENTGTKSNGRRLCKACRRARSAASQAVTA